MPLSAVDIIARKRDGLELTAEEIGLFVRGVADGSIPDYQIAAWLMAVVLRGMSAREAYDLTDAMLSSGERISPDLLSGSTVDKHSTGGVGDKTTLVVAPIAAAAGLTVAKMSGRGLGHTGGTLDKLEAIPGLRTTLTVRELLAQAARVGLAIAGQTAELVPADRALYALRDATATVQNPALIAASIMSKKLAGGARAIVLDVKVGRGAFVKDVESARELAKLMVDIGVRVGRRMSAVLTRMDEPLGQAVGNACEVEEAAATLRGEGPPDFSRLCRVVAGEMLELGGAAPAGQGEARAQEVIATGAAFAKLREMVEAQGGQPRSLDQPLCGLRPAVEHVVVAPKQGIVAGVNAELIGRAAMQAGAGRWRKEDTVDPAAGVRLVAKAGDQIAPGEPLAQVLASSSEQAGAAAELVKAAYRIGDRPPERAALVLDRIRGNPPQGRSDQPR